MSQHPPEPNQALTDAATHALLVLDRRGDNLQTHWFTTERAVFFQAEPSPSLFIKVYLNRSQLEREVETLRRAANAGIPVPPVVAFEVGPPAVLITEQVVGMTLSSEYQRAAIETGRVLRRFHALGASPPCVDGQWCWSEFVRYWLERELGVAEEREALTQDDARRLRRHFATLAPILDERPMVLVHSDFQTEHVLIDPETQRVTALLDFVDAQPGDPLVDIAVLTLFDRALEPLVLRGYGIDAGEAGILLPTYRVLRHLVAANWLMENGMPHLAPPHERAVRQFVRELERGSGEPTTDPHL